MRRFRALSSVDYIVVKDTETVSLDGRQNLHGKVVIIADSVQAPKTQIVHLYAVRSFPCRDGIQANLALAERYTHVRGIGFQQIEQCQGRYGISLSPNIA
jgi:hypothetical protein